MPLQPVFIRKYELGGFHITIINLRIYFDEYYTSGLNFSACHTFRASPFPDDKMLPGFQCSLFVALFFNLENVFY